MTLSVQLYTIFAMIGMGMYLGAALDTYHRFLKRHKRKRWRVFFWDILFWLGNALLFFFVLLTVNQAELRIYIFFAILCGYAAYQSLLRLLYLRVLEGIIRLFILAYRFLYACIRIILVLPILWVINILLTIASFLWRSVYRVIAWGAYILLGIFKWIVQMIWRGTPKKVRQFLLKYAGIFKYIKNIIQKWRGKCKR